MRNNGGRHAAAAVHVLEHRILGRLPSLAGALCKEPSQPGDVRRAYDSAIEMAFFILYVLAAESTVAPIAASNGRLSRHSLLRLAQTLTHKRARGVVWDASSTATCEFLRRLSEDDESHRKNQGFGKWASKLFFSPLPDTVLNDLLINLACTDIAAIDVASVGAVFERLLESTLTVDDEGCLSISSSRRRRHSGSYYTPDAVVRLILQRVLDEDSELPLVLDPACGCGSFLVSAVRLIAENLARRPRHVGRSLAELRLQAARHCVYGMDINPVAARLTKLSLGLAVNGGDGSLVELDDHIIAAYSLTTERPESWPEQFHAIVGNPPFVNTKLLSKTDPALKAYLTRDQNFSTCSGCFDLYVAFVERALKDGAARGANVGFVLPNKVTVANYAQRLRRLALQTCSRIEITDIGDLALFGATGVYPCLCIFHGRKPQAPVARCAVVWSRAKMPDVQNGADLSVSVVCQERRAVEQAIWSPRRKTRSVRVRLGDLCDIQAGLAGYTARDVLPAILQTRDETGHVAPFIVSRNIVKFGLSLGGVRYMRHAFDNPFFDLDHGALTPGKRNLFLQPKVVLAGMTREIRACYRAAPLAVGVGVYCIVKSELPLSAVVAIVNSMAFTCLYRARFAAKHLAGGYLAINCAQLMDADVTTIDSEAAVSRLVAWEKALRQPGVTPARRLAYEREMAHLLRVRPRDFAGLKYVDKASEPLLARLCQHADR